MTSLTVICGAAVGLGVFTMLRALARPSVDSALLVGRYDAANAAPKRTSRTGAGWKAAVADALIARGFDARSAAADLELTATPPEAFLAGKAVLALVGLVLPLLVSLAWSAVGLSLPLEIPAVLSLGSAAGFFYLPDLQLRKKAALARAELRRTLGSYLDLVSMGLAGGRGLAEALSVAAQVGEGWTFRLLAETADRARPLGLSPWQALGQLGDRLRMPELVDLGATLNLAGTEGAQIRGSLIARAATIRGRTLADASGTAAADDQSMGIAQVILGLGFLLFITYPAVYQVVAIK